MTKALTKATIKAALAAGVSEGKTRVVLWDARPAGLGLKLRASGSASWVFVYRPKGSPKGTPARTVTLGAYPTTELDDARREALKLAGKAASGGDPAAELRQQRLRVRSRLSAALDGYEKELIRRRVVARAEAMSILRRGFAPMVGEEVGSLDQPMLINRIAAIATRQHKRKDGSVYTTPGAAAEFRKHAHAFLAWCTATGLTKHNALAGYRIPRQTREEMLAGTHGRQGKALADDEIVKVWAAAGDMGAFGGLVRLGLLSGLRRNEIAELEWSDIRDDAIVIPASRSKMGREHFVPLTPAMTTVLSAQPETSNPLVFPSPVSNGVMNGWSKLLPRVAKASGVGFRIHDTRRTCRTLMSRLGIEEAIAELAIGHVRRGLVGIYNKDVQWPARISAFKKVSAHVLGLVASSGDAETGSETPETAVVRLPSPRKTG